MREAIGFDRAPAPREIEHVPSVSSGVRAVALQQDGTLLMIGERVNTLGSRKVKRLLLDDDYDGVMEYRPRAGRERRARARCAAWR